MKEAFHIATTGRPGPVLIDMPKDVQTRRSSPDWDPPMNLPGYRPIPRPPRRSSKQVLAAIRASKKPIIYAGGGVIARRRGRRSCGSSPSRPASRSP